MMKKILSDIKFFVGGIVHKIKSLEEDTPVSFYIIVINVAIYGVVFFLGDAIENLFVVNFNNLSNGESFHTIFLHMFMHPTWGHIIFNMVILFHFAPLAESLLRAKKFIVFYLLAGLIALGLQYMLRTYIPGINDTFTGANGPIFALFGFGAILFPNTMIKLPLPRNPVRLKNAAWVVILAMLIASILLDLSFGIWAIGGGYLTGRIYGAYLTRKKQIRLLKEKFPWIFSKE